MSDKRKRVLDANERDDEQPDPKRPRVPVLESAIVQAMIVKSLPIICSAFVPIIKEAVREEIERALDMPDAARIGGGRNSPKRIGGPAGRNLKLCFGTTLSTSLFTGGTVEGENGTSIDVMLLDAKSGQHVRSGPEASAKLDVVALDGDFNYENDDDWTEEEFKNHIVKEREGKGPLLVGELQVSLKDGTGTLGKLSFTDSSCRTRSRKFRLGLKIASGFCEGVRIREATTEAFAVKHRRGELYKKHYPPALEDEVWRLENIGKDGAFHNKLCENGIVTVEDFLKYHVRDHQKLRKILGGGMSNKMWEKLVDHAKTCTLNDKRYIYSQDERKEYGAIFNVICEFQTLIADGRFYSAESLSDGLKGSADALVKDAYSNWNRVIEYDARAPVEHMKNKKATELEKESLPSPSSYFAYAEEGESLLAPSGHFADSVGGGPMTTGYDGNQTAGNTNLPQNADFNAHMPAENPSFVPQNNSVGSAYQAQFTRNDSTQLGPEPICQSSMIPPFDQSVEHPDQGIDYDWDIQQWLFSMDGASSGLHDSGFASSYFSFGDERSRASNKAVVSWLKIKSAMRWGTFVRKKAAERRAAQLVELVELHNCIYMEHGA